MMSRLMLVLGVAPVLAPSLGAVVLLHGSWHWVFAALVVMGGLLLIVAALALPETLPPSHRPPLRVRGVLSTYARLLRDARFVVLVCVGALGMAGLFAYIAGASFVLQGRYDMDEQTFALVFGAGAVALIATTQVNVVLLKWFSPARIVVWALGAGAVASAVFVGLALTHTGGCSRLPDPGVVDPGRDGPGHPQRARARPVPALGIRGDRGRLCWAPPSSAWAPWSLRWWVCSATTNSRWPS